MGIHILHCHRGMAWPSDPSKLADQGVREGLRGGLGPLLSRKGAPGPQGHLRGWSPGPNGLRGEERRLQESPW